jgi:hypothetical protein
MKTIAAMSHPAGMAEMALAARPALRRGCDGTPSIVGREGVGAVGYQFPRERRR